MKNTTLQSSLTQLDTFLHLYLVNKAPSIPNNIKEIIVKYSPIITLIVLVFSLPAILFIIGLGALISPFAFLGGVGAGLSFSFFNLFFLVSIILTGLALPGLFARKITGWNYLFYASLINAIYSLLTLNPGNLIIGTLFTWYILYQIKSYYK